MGIGGRNTEADGEQDDCSKECSVGGTSNIDIDMDMDMDDDDGHGYGH